MSVCLVQPSEPASVVRHPPLLQHKADQLFEKCILLFNNYPQLRSSVPNRQESSMPHIIGFGDPNTRYSYLSRSMTALAWTDFLLSLRNDIMKMVGIKYNLVTMRIYKQSSKIRCTPEDYVNNDRSDHGPKFTCVMLGNSDTLIIEHKGKKQTVIKSKYGDIFTLRIQTEPWYQRFPKQVKKQATKVILVFTTYTRSDTL